MTSLCHVTKPCDSFNHVTLLCHVIRNTECSDHCFVKACLIQNVTRNRHQRNHVINETDFVVDDDVMMTSQNRTTHANLKRRDQISCTPKEGIEIAAGSYARIIRRLIIYESSRDNNHMCRRLDRRRGHQ